MWAHARVFYQPIPISESKLVKVLEIILNMLFM